MLKLFRGTIPWARNDVEQGDFCENVWAENDQAAIAELASRMVDIEEDGLLPDEMRTEDERAERLQEFIDNAGPYAAEEIALNIKNDILALLAGPEGEMTEQADAAYDTICDLLDQYGHGVKETS